MRRLLLFTLLVMLALAACEEEGEATPTPVPPEPTGVALNPPQVWIDRPLSGETIILGITSPELVAHASALSGNATLQVRDDLGQTLSTVDLGSAVDTVAVGGQLNRYEGDWMQAILPLLEQAGGPVTLELTVLVSGVPSNPVVLIFMKPSPTPTGSPTVTPSITPSETPTFTPSPTSTATLTETPSNTPTDTPTFTDTPTITSTPTITLTPTLSPTLTPTLTPTRRPEIGFIDKEEVPCRVTAVRGLRVAAMLAPNRDTVLYIEWPDVYDVTGKTLVGPTIWWQIFLPQTRNPAWVSSNEVLSTGSCLLVKDEEPPLPGPPPVQPPPQNNPPQDSPPGQPVIYFFTTNTTQVSDSTCATLSWSVEYVDAVYLNGNGVVGNGSRAVCGQEFGYGDIGSLTYTLSIQKDGATVDSRSITLTYSATAPPPPPVVTTVPPVVTTPPPVVVRILSFTVSSTLLYETTCVTASWSVSNADRVTFSVDGAVYVVSSKSSSAVCYSDTSGSTVTLRLRALRDGTVHDSQSIVLTRLSIPQ